ncbi:MAG: TIGR03617 family F420-dependent LLM class oxidoreductase [Acidimicrobiales bacterium]|nr:TIGR03617 family F420-dependent LLM class oxidoreductase [Acidimicrobiales bacterium]
MRIDTQLRAPLGDAGREAAELRDAGFDGVFTFEGPHDVFLPLAAASAVAGLDLYTNLAIAFPRSPTHLAHTAYDLHQASGGRFALGLGTQIRPHIEKRYGATWSRPVARLRELIEATRAVLSCWQDGGRLDVRGEFYELTLMPPTFNPGPLPGGPPPIWAGALGPRMTRMVAEVADGLLVHPFNSDAFVRGQTLPGVDAGLAASGRARGDFTLVCEAIVCAWRDERERETAVAGAKGLVAFYGSTPAYRPVLEAEGAGDLQPELNRLTKEGRWDELGGVVDDDLLERIAVCGEPADVARRIHDRFGGVADRLAFYTPYEVDPSLTAEVLDRLR